MEATPVGLAAFRFEVPMPFPFGNFPRASGDEEQEATRKKRYPRKREC